MNEVTRILSAFSQGDPHAAEQLLPLVYDELHGTGPRHSHQTLQATALVHEAYLRARHAYILQACGEDGELRRRIEALLRVHDEERCFLESPTHEFHALLGASPGEDLDTPIGPYKLLEKIGEGGMGTVFLAEQTQPVQRQVAIKVIRPGMDSAKVIARFEVERQALLQIAYLKAGKTREAAKRIEERLAAARQQSQPNTPQLSSALALAGKGWLDLKKFSPAEAVLRECLLLREELGRDKQVRPWQVANVRSLLGGALLGQEKYAEAAPLLMAGYAGLKQDEKAIPPQSRSLFADALSRLVDLCQATGKKEDAAKWQLELKNFRAAEKNRDH